MKIGALSRNALMPSAVRPALMPQPPIGALAQNQVVDPSWFRLDGSKKGMGFLGPLKTPDGKTATEISIGVDFDGKEREIPSLVPTLSKEEIDFLLQGNDPSEAIIQKAVEHARERIRQGKPVFAE